MIYSVKKTKQDRIIGGLIGILYLIFGIAILANLDLGVLTLVTFLGFNLIIMGLSKFINYNYSRKNSKVFSKWDLLIGFIGILMGVLVIFNSSLGTDVIIILTSFTMFIQGIYLLYYSYANESISAWGKKISMILGVLILILSGLTLMYKGFVIKTMIIILSLSFILNGLVKVSSSFEQYFDIDDGSENN